MYGITLDGVKKYMDTTLILKNITFQINEGEIVGIIGNNGCGKTTVLKLIAGILELNHCAGYPYAPIPPGYDEGWVRISKGITCSYLEQIPQYDKVLKVIDVLNLSFTEVYEIEVKMRQLEHDMTHLEGNNLKKSLETYSELMQLYEVKGGYEIHEKLSKICKGLKFEESFLNQDFHSLSGGEKTRVLLGKLLIDPSDILLLDEPTNHLDMDSVEWLQEYIKTYKGIVIVVSHDRYFLDQIVTKIIEIENKVSKIYIGNYSDFVYQKEEQSRVQDNNFREQQKTIHQMEESIKELKDWAKRADNTKFFKRAASMQIKLDKMERMEKPQNKKNMNLDIKTVERSGNVVIKASNLSKQYDEKTLFKDADLLVNYGERVALIGANGSGKSTFIKILLGEVMPDSGEISLGANIKLAYLPQNIVFDEEETTVLEYFREGLSILEGKAREYLAKFMFYGGSVYKKIKLLSGGERYRLKLSKLLFGDVNLLILDEPTNHLDITSIESLETALSNFKGTIFLVSHDRYFINKICERVINIEESKFQCYLGNYDYFKQEKELKEIKSQQAIAPSYKDKKEKEISIKKDSRNGSRGSTKNNHTAKKSELEEQIKTIENQLNEIEIEMETVNTDFKMLGGLCNKKEELNKELEHLLEKWVNI